MPLGRLGEPSDIANAAAVPGQRPRLVDHRSDDHRRRRRHPRRGARAARPRPEPWRAATTTTRGRRSRSSEPSRSRSRSSGCPVAWLAAPLDPPRALAVCAGVAILLVGGLTLGDDDPDTTGDTPAEERDNSAKLPLKGTTTTEPRTTTTRPADHDHHHPGRPRLRRAGRRGADRLQLRGVAAGRPRHGRPHGPRPARPGQLRGGGRAGRDRHDQPRTASREAELYPISRNGEVGPPVVLGLADQVLPAGRPDRLWLIDGGGGPTEGEASPARRPTCGWWTSPARPCGPSRSRAPTCHAPWRKASCSTEADGSTWPMKRASGPIAVGWTVGVMGGDLLLISCDDDAVVR